MSLANLLDEIRADLRSLPALTRVYEGVPDSINEFPAVIVASMGGRCWLASHDSTIQCEHEIRVEVHVQMKDLARGAAEISGIASDISHRLYHGFVTDRYNGTMITTGNPQAANGATAPIDYTIGPAEWASQQTYAMLCDFRVVTQQKAVP